VQGKVQRHIGWLVGSASNVLIMQIVDAYLNGDGNLVKILILIPLSSHQNEALLIYHRNTKAPSKWNPTTRTTKTNKTNARQPNCKLIH
jgi:hypothetical protein